MEIAEKQEPNQFANPTYNPNEPQTNPHASATVSIIEADGKTRFTAKTRKLYRILGITEIVLGVFSILSQTIVLIWATEIFSCMLHDWLWFFDLEPVPSEAAGIWCGVMFILTGVVGLKACKEGVHKYWITFSMFLNLFCSFLVFALMGLAALNIKDIGKTLCNQMNNLAVTFDVFMIISGCLILVISVWALILACDARYNCCPEDRGENYNVMYEEDVSRPGTPNPGTARAWTVGEQQPQQTITELSSPPPPYPSEK